MATHYRTQALILDKRNFREADRFFTVFSKEFGKIEPLARGERKIKSKLRGGLELYYLSDIEFIQGRYWKTLVDASLINNFNKVRSDLRKLEIASWLASVSTSLIQGQEKDLDLWGLLLKSFQRLNTESYNFLVYQYFFWRFVSHLGYRPQLYNCAACNKKLKSDQLYFSASQGGLVCRYCKQGLNQKTDTETVKIIRSILEKDWQQVTKLKVNNHQQSLSQLSSFYYSYLKAL